ncbi:MAG TPA: SCO family protein [Steroidobacteraceae bacterium]|jgi:protein SCO1/2|nr:SCO family protein [Steroidobacteraceae bacterium]
MTARSKIVSLVFIGFAAAGGIAAALLWPQQQPAMELATGTLLTPRRALPDFSLIDSQGRSFGPANLRGRWSMLFFGYTNCPDFCPTTLSTLAAMQKQLRAEHSVIPQVIFVSVDAKRDTPAQLANYVPYFDPEFIGLTAADQPAIEALAKQWGVAVMVQPPKDGSYTVDHSSAIFVLDPAGRLAAILSGPFTVGALQSDFRRIVTGGA